MNECGKQFNSRIVCLIIVTCLHNINAMWGCHHYTDSETDMINSGVSDKKVCEQQGRVHTGGNNTDFFGCGECWCCKPVKSSTTSDTSINGSQMTTVSSILETEKDHDICDCDCPESSKWDFRRENNLTREELREVLKDKLFLLEDDIKVDIKNTTSYQNSKRSAGDKRRSSAIIGYLSVIMITIPIAIIILCDLSRVIRA